MASTFTRCVSNEMILRNLKSNRGKLWSQEDLQPVDHHGLGAEDLSAVNLLGWSWCQEAMIMEGRMETVSPTPAYQARTLNPCHHAYIQNRSLSLGYTGYNIVSCFAAV